ncbi:MAG TPA: phytanoyl-CoA dioxygenase family protein [Trueperaceae bacterium]
MPATEQNSELRSHYEREGYVLVHDVLDAELVEEARRHVDWLLERNPGLRPEQLHHDLMKHDPFWVRLISDPRLLDVAEQFLGPDIALFASHYIAKRPHDGQAVLWHQDGSYWPLEPVRVVTLWLALDRTDPENGCLRVIPRSQDLDLQEMKERSDVENVLGSGLDDSLVDDSEAVDILLEPGGVEIHHPNLIHGSHANTSDRWRRGLTIRYIPTSTRIKSDEPWPSAFLLRGKAAAGINRYQPWPSYVEGRHMPFRGSDEWNEEAERANRRPGVIRADTNGGAA